MVDHHYSTGLAGSGRSSGASERCVAMLLLAVSGAIGASLIAMLASLVTGGAPAWVWLSGVALGAAGGLFMGAALHAVPHRPAAGR